MMSYDFAIWEGDVPTGPHAATATYQELIARYDADDALVEPTARIQAYAEALAAQFPDEESEESPWSAGSPVGAGTGPFLYICVGYSYADQVGPVAERLAAEHGLVFFNPQTTPGNPGRVTITTGVGSAALPESWPRFLSHVLREVDDYVIVDSGEDHLFAQARNDDGTFTLEYRDGSPQKHYQVQGVDLGDVSGALSQWSEGRRDFIPTHTWHRLTDWD